MSETPNEPTVTFEQLYVPPLPYLLEQDGRGDEFIGDDGMTDVQRDNARFFTYHLNTDPRWQQIFEHKDFIPCGVPNRNSDCFPCYTGIREMQEAEGIIEKGAPLWNYGVTGESGINLPFKVFPESGIMPAYPAIDLSSYGVYPRLAADGATGTRYSDEYSKAWDRDATYSYFPKHLIKVVPWQQFDFVGRAADL